jgi:hypothetical protein
VRECIADDGEPASGTRVEVTEPLPESVVGGKLHVAGRVTLPPGKVETPILRVNGADAPVVDGMWSLDLSPAKEGLFRIRVVCAYPGEPATVVEVPVKVDRTPPSIEFSDPSAEVGVHPDGEGRVAGVVTDANLVRVTINGRNVKVTRQGEFEETFLLSENGETRVEVRAVDAAGNESLAVRRLRTSPDPSTSSQTAPSPSPTPPRSVSTKISVISTPTVEALRWLLAHQSPDGGWECEGYRRWCDGTPAKGTGPDGAGKPQYDVGITSLAVLALWGGSERAPANEAPAIRTAAEAGLRYLRNVQDSEGCFGPRQTTHYIYNHAIASIAMVEGYAATANAAQRLSAQKALDFIAAARNPYFAWRYGVQPGDNDTSVTGWMMSALAAARRTNAEDVKAGREPSFRVDPSTSDGIKAWIDKVTDDKGRAGYQTRGTGPARMTDLVDKFPAEKSESMTAIAVLARLELGTDPTSQPVADGARLCGACLPEWNTLDGSIDFYYWYYATVALNRIGGSTAGVWNRALSAAVLPAQHKDGDYCGYLGSWDPLDPWGSDGGRVYTTAIIALALEAAGPDPILPAVSGEPAAPASSTALSELRTRLSRLLISREGLIDTCGECGGTGKRAHRIPAGYENVDCKACSGKGKVLDRTRFTTAFWSLKSPAWRSLPDSKASFDRKLAECTADPSKASPIRKHAITSLALVDDRHAVATVLEDGLATVETRWIWYGASGKSAAGWYLFDETADGPWPR